MKRLICVLLTAVLTCALFLGNVCAEEAKAKPGVTVYFPNWNIYSDSRQDVNGLPWDRIDCVNHAFWKSFPGTAALPLNQLIPGQIRIRTIPWRISLSMRNVRRSIRTSRS